MQKFVLICKDKRDAAALRASTREAHLAYLEALTSVRLELAGPLLNDDDQPIGSLLIIDAPSREAAHAFAADDPYAKAGLFEDVEIRPFRFVAGDLTLARG